MTDEELAALFHFTYERLAPQYGYVTRPETKVLDFESPNGRLMVAVVREIRSRLVRPEARVTWEECSNASDEFLRFDSGAVMIHWYRSYLYVKRHDGQWFKAAFDQPLPQKESP